MRSRRLSILFCAALLFTGATTRGDDNPYDIPSAIDSELRAGLNDLFNMRFDAAEKRFLALQERADEHPMVALAAALVPWWRVTSQVLERDEERSQPFLDAADHCLKVSHHWFRRDRRGEAHLAMGTTLGLMSRWSAANHAWLTAWSRGGKSTSHLDTALKRNPQAIDAYMTLGTFDYAKELICRQLNMKQDESEKGQGLRELQAAYHGGVYFRIPSGVLLAGLLTNESPPDAIPVLKELRQELPESPFIHIVYVTALYNAGQIPDMEREAADFLVKAESGPYVGYKPQAYFAEGLLAFRREKWADAAASFHRASDRGPEENPYTTWSMLYEGYCYDALGERAKAKERYEAVVARKPRYASHERAKMRLDSPFKKTDVEMRKVEL